MKAISVSEARKCLYHLLDEAAGSHEPVHIIYWIGFPHDLNCTQKKL